jgi:hypothetical protein
LAARGGNLVYLVSLVDFVCLVQMICGTKQTRQTKHAGSQPLASRRVAGWLSGLAFSNRLSLKILVLQKQAYPPTASTKINSLDTLR